MHPLSKSASAQSKLRLGGVAVGNGIKLSYLGHYSCYGVTDERYSVKLESSSAH